MKPPNSIYGRLRLTYIGLAPIPLLLVGLALTWMAFRVQRAQVLNLQQELAQRMGAEVAANINSLQTDLTITAHVTDLAHRSQPEQQEILGLLQARRKAFVELALLDQAGREVVHLSHQDIILDRDYLDRSRSEEYRFLSANPQAEVYFSPVRTISETGEPLMTVAIPLLEARTGTLLAVLTADVRFRDIWSLIAKEDLPAGDLIYIVDQQDRVVAHPNPSIVLMKTFFNVPPSQGGYSGLDHAPALMGIDRRHFGDQVLTIIAETPARKVINQAWRSWAVILGLVLVTVGTAGALALVAANYITRPIQALVKVAEAIRAGDLAQQASTTGISELDTLANTFNSMTDQLRHTLVDLEGRVAARTQALKTSAEVSRNLSTILDANQLVTEVAGLVQSAFQYYHVNIFMFDESGQNLVLVTGTGAVGQALLAEQRFAPKDAGLISRAAATNQPILAADVSLNPDWVPNPWLPDTKAELVVPIARGALVLGVLDIQHHTVFGLNQADADLMQSIANQLAVALLNAQTFERLVAEKLAEARRKEEAESRLAAYQRSPAGQAELFASELLVEPENSLIALHQLAQAAAENPEAAALLSHLPEYLDDTQPHAKERASFDMLALAKIAEGFNYLYSSRDVPELLLPGLRALTKQLERPTIAGWQGSVESLLIYQLCQSAIEAGSIPQITQLDWERLAELQPSSMPTPDSPATQSVETENKLPAEFPLADLVQVLFEFQDAIEALVAYERVITPSDKLAYLVTAVERLRHIERQARNRLGGADINLVVSICENWQAIIAGALSELQTQARINCRLLTRHTRQNDSDIALILGVRNDGRGAAVNLKINIMPGPEFTILDNAVEIGQLPPGEEEQVTIRVRPRWDQKDAQFRARFVVFYSDPRGPDQSEHFADIVQLIAEPAPFQHIPNPYVAGTPLKAGSPLFFGRCDLLATIQENLAAAHRNNLVFIGQRRMGKTSLLKQLIVYLDSNYIPVYLDGQVLGLDPGMANFFLTLATEIAFAIDDRGIKIAAPSLEEFEPRPAGVFEHSFLPKVIQAIGSRQLIILFDEFEELERAVQQGQLDVSIFGYLRHLMQHTANLSFIFCGTHRLEELTTDYWSVLFNISLYQRVSYLSHEEVLQLVQEPVQAYGLQYDDLALEKIWRVTAGHPYFLQLLCHSLVNRHNKNKRSYVTIADVNAALEDILGAGEAHFVYLWTESTLDEQLALVVMSREIPLTGSVQAVQVADILAEWGVQVERKAIRDAMYRLNLRDILKVDELEGAGESMFRWQLGLLGLWVGKYKSLGRVLDEIAG